MFPNPINQFHKNYYDMKNLLTVTGVIEAGTGLAMITFPSALALIVIIYLVSDKL
jgi:hypothetical protein